MTQEDVAVQMRLAKSVLSRQESGVGTRPTRRTAERCAVAVGAPIEIRVGTRR